ncbi:MAG TPA: hypothetical protein VM661_13200 [Candidatus Sulfotelmatobacter sp.]|jgi:hypothetical protein|nr:hypothetical protein [Candidatus Sulfotelmatobacter sp.]
MSSPLPPALPSVPAAAPTQAAAPAAPVAQASVANPQSLPPALAQLTVGAKVDAQVLASIGQPPNLTVQVQTDRGGMTLQTEMPLPQGSSVTLLLTAQGGQPQFRIAALNGQPVTAQGQIVASASASQTATASPTAVQPASAELQSAPPADAGIRATVLPSPQSSLPQGAGQSSAALSSPGGSPALPPGNSVTVRILSVEPAPLAQGASPERPVQTPVRAAQAYGAAAQTSGVPAGGGQTTPPQAVSPQPVPSQPAQPASPTASPTASPPLAPPSVPSATEVSQGQIAPQSGPPEPVPSQPASLQPAFPQAPVLQSAAQPVPVSSPPLQPAAQLVAQPAGQNVLLSAPPPSFQQGPSPQASVAGLVLQGTVPDTSRPASPQIQTPVGLLALQAQVDLSPGDKVVVQLVSEPAPPEATPQPDPDGARPPLRKGLDLIRAALPQLAEQIERQLPSLDHASGHSRLAFQLLALTTAVRSGKAEPLVAAEPAAGEPSLLSALAPHHGLVQGLEQELASLRQTVTLPGSGVDQWQAYVLPFLVEGKPQELRLVVRDKPQNEAEARRREDEGTRFLIDLDMTNLGAVQLDGLVKGRAKRFDLIIRTHVALSESLRMGIADVFVTTLDGFGMTGRTSFQTVPVFIEPQRLSGSPLLPTA